VQALIPDLPSVYDEPFADSSQLATLLVAREARRDVTVALTGDGGDELFGGYTRHAWVDRIDERARWLGRPGRLGAAWLLERASPQTWDRLYAIVGGRGRLPALTHAGDKAHKLAALLRTRSVAGAYETLADVWPRAALPLAGAVPDWPRPSHPTGLRSASEEFMFRDLTEYLPHDILTKVDRATMAVSLEARAPLLDYRLVEFAWRLAPALRARRGVSKWLLRQVLAPYVPVHLVDRPKQGFGVPIAVWLRGPLRPWAEDLLDERSLNGSGLLHARLWAVLMFEAWRRAWSRPEPDTMPPSVRYTEAPLA
jgi:asparagine synthase (glutamine-hydrolysing)